MAINSLSSASNGLAGLASGMDTESMVNQMLAGTQTKIDTQNQKKTQLEYKKEMYQDVITNLQNFQSTYFDYTNQATNLRSQSFFQAKNVSTSSKAYTVTAGSSAAVGTVKIDSISRLATSYKQVTKNAVSAGLSGKVDTAALENLKTNLNDAKLTFSVGDKSVEISATDLVGKSTFEAEKTINKLLEDNGVEGTISYLNSGFTFAANDSKSQVKITGDETALELIGGKEMSGTGTGSFSLNPTAVMPTINVTVDGISKDITFNPFSDKSVVEQLRSGISSAFDAGIEVKEDGNGGFSIEALNSSRVITITGDSEVLDAIGMKQNASNHIRLNQSLTETQFATQVQGAVQRFSINGVDFSFSSDQSLTSVMTAINNSDAGVTVSYSSTTDKFTIEADSTGERSGAFEISQTEGNLMSAMFGYAPSGNVSGTSLVKPQTSGDLSNEGVVSADNPLKDSTMNLVVNGSSVALTLEGSYSSADSIVRQLNKALEKQFGKDEETGLANVSFAIENGKVSIVTQGDYTAEVQDGSFKALGFDTSVTGETTLAEVGIEDEVSFTIGGSTLTFSSSTKLSDMIDKVNTAARDAGAAEDIMTLNQADPYIRICGVEIPMNFLDSSGKLFGATKGDISTGSTAPTASELFDVTEGTNAKMTVNGIEIERSSNNFTLDGITYALNSTTDEASTVTVTQDIDKIYDTVVKFVEDYNKLINDMNELLDADATYRDYDPLTTAQEEEMTEEQVKKWEAKAKEGLLRNDSTITNVLSSLRQTLYASPSGATALYKLGITTSYFGTRDNLTIEDTGELKSLIAADPEAIMNLFTDTENGLATLMNNALDRAVSSSPSNPGSLVKIAGIKGKSDTSSSLYKQIKTIETTLDSLEDKYESEYDRYWGEFNQMEQLISNMNSTSSWLTQMMSS